MQAEQIIPFLETWGHLTSLLVRSFLFIYTNVYATQGPRAPQYRVPLCGIVRKGKNKVYRFMQEI